MNHFSIDTESLSVRLDAALLSIGVQQFDPATGKMGATFYVEIDFDSAVKSGHVMGSTLTWWMRQGDAAKRVFDDKPQNKKPLSVALEEMCTWFRGKGVAPVVWANGAADDIAWLRNAFVNGCVGLSEPWNFRNVRDMRTIVDLPGVVYPTHIAFVGAKHHALNDATHQAKVISDCWQQIAKRVLTAPDQHHSAEEEEL